MSTIQSLQPHLLWQWFAQLCAIPHPSHHEEQVAKFMLDWAKQQGLYAERDEAGNVLIRKPATAGMEDRKGIALQAHLDMVPQANEGTVHDFTKDPIQPYIDGEWVKAKGTTLGADNGIGLASAMAVLESTDLAHPELEVLLTMTEEAGMDGAKGLRPNWLTSPIMINTDTEENGEIYMGCAGGLDANAEMPVELEANSFTHSYQLVLKGLRGGHSGGDIHTGRANAIKVLARFLAEFSQKQPHFAFGLSDIRGGSVRNAIPREAFATLHFNGDVAQLKSAVEKFEILLQQELALAEPSLTLTLAETAKTTHVFNHHSTQTVIHWLNSLPNGVIRNSDVVEGVVETSLSLGVLQTTETKVHAIILIRSLIESGKEYVQSQLQSLTEMLGGHVAFSGNYPGWAPHSDSEIMQLTKTLYDEVLGYESVVKVIHAGLECGLIKEKYPNIDVVSIGPTIHNAHSPDEKVHIPAVQIYWELLSKILANAPKK
ncbi:aminoacyl-histidine dipeptidase [Conservatibacter flavescens]|uniref:Cytosol non-specific dipeptidase n=1 Tax=Conservatibacter flavescens TaxID=28161 RepID=A0A2M8S2N2_9PAST|nr:aminoacyl-histidine dipeptidase [Conservatibacter flavescens]PJG85368.1 cytosol nonspecific dipeptidase [Conservatibacter flavescens]